MAKARSTSQQLSDGPFWLNVAVKFGAPTVLAGYLVWVFVSDVVGSQKHIIAAMEQHQKDMAGLVQHLQEDTSRGWALVSVSQRICLNTAKNDQDRMQCVISMNAPGGGKQP